MEELTKYQIVLLTLFISFVTSLATGIVTVSLMDQSPQGVTQNINRVVERTIERVVAGPETVTEVEVPVVVSEEDLIVKVVDIATPSIAKLVRKQGDKIETVSVAFAIAPNWFVAATVPERVVGQESDYQLKLENGKLLPVVTIESPATGVSFLKYSGDNVPTLALSNKEGQIGQTVVAVGSIVEERHGIAVGILSGVSGNSSTSTPQVFKTNAATSDNIGSPMLNIKGEIIGMSYNAAGAIASKDLKVMFDSIR